MGRITRRAGLAGGAALAGATVAAAILLRKPPEVMVLHPASAAGDSPLLGMEALVRAEPAKALPPIAFQDAEGQAHTLTEFAGRGVVLNLWATWCLPCIAELPALATLQTRGAPDGIAVVTLSVDRGGAAVVRRFFDAHGIRDLDIWVDPTGEAPRILGARGVPTTLVVDRRGREQARLEGSAAWGSDAALAAVKRLVG